MRHRRTTYALGLAGALPALLLAGCSKGPADVVERFTRAAAAGDVTKAVDDVDPTLRQIGGMKMAAALEQVAAKAKGRGGLKDVTVTSQTSDGDYGSATVRESFGDGTTITETEKVRKVDGRWFVTM